MQWNKQTYTGWGRALQSTADMARPERHAALGYLIAETDSILPVGNLRSYGDAALADNGRVLSTVRLDRLIAFDAKTGVLEAEPGITLGEILRIFAPRGWMPAVLPGTGATTLGGAIANDVHGKNHHVAGSFGNHVKSLVLMTADGRAREISEEVEPELFHATIGGVGQTGLITAATIQLAPCPTTGVQVHERRIGNLDDFLETFDAATATYQVGWIDALASGSSLGRGIFEEAEFDPNAVHPFPKREATSFPPIPSRLALATASVRLFNAIYWRRTPVAGRRVSRPLGKFFFPLDKLSNWNKVYGKKGFHQFQCVVPAETGDQSLRQMLELVSAAGIASPLAVLKRLGPGRAGYLSFPMEGYTLAVDLPNRTGVRSLLTALNDVTLKHGGRIYLAKDSALKADAMEQMYPEIDAYRKAVASADPDGKFISDMATRLNLRGDA